MKIYFIWYLIPVVLLAMPLFWLVLRNERKRLLFLLLLSFGVLSLLHIIFALAALGLIVIAHQIVAANKAGRLTAGRALLLSIIIAVATLGIGKYGRHGVVAIWGNSDWVVSHFIMPLGISYFVFRLLQYVFDHLRGVLDDNSFLKLATFVMFIPTFPAGPLETYQGFYSKHSQEFDRNLFYTGLRRIAFGYFQKVFIVSFLFDAVIVGIIPVALNQPHFTWNTIHPLWPLVYVISNFVRAYFDLSAYTDLAMGFSSLFGFRIMENFDKPFWKKNLSDFWRCWHISLSSWCRDNVYFPVSGLTRKPWLAIYASMLTMGLWHNISINWTLWGVYHGTGIIVVLGWSSHKKALRKARKKAGKPPAPTYERFTGWLGYPATFFYVALGYAFVSMDTAQSGLEVFYLCIRGPIVFIINVLR